MDFLDPRKRRSHNNRLIVGYLLIAVAIGLAGWLLLKAASGISVDTKTGQIIQNGLLFVDSQPGGAKIYLNNKLQESTTAARLVIPAGNYDLTIKKDGYRTWERSVTVNEGKVARYVYPFLFPVTPRVENIKTYAKNPPLITQSPDRRWLLVESPTSSGTKVSFDEFDTSRPDQVPKALTIPSAILSGATAGNHKLQEVEWASNNRHLLLMHSYAGGSEFIIFNRGRPAESLNVNKVFKVTPTQVALRDKKIDQLYIFSGSSGDLQIADSDRTTVSILLRKVIAFKSSGPALISYITAENSPKNHINARIWDGQRSYTFYNFPLGSKYLLELAQFQGHWYYVAGSNRDSRVNVYKDPLDGLRNPSIAAAIPMLSLNIKGVTKVSFSANTRFIAAEAGQSLSIYDLEQQDNYRYTISEKLSAPLRWMDGHRLISNSKNTFFVTDYDSTNHQLLLPSYSLAGGYFSPDYKRMFITNPSNNDSVVLQLADMRSGSDLPRQ